MKRIILGAILGAAFIIGCAGAASGPMVGTWELKLSDEAQKMMDAAAKAGAPDAKAPNISIDFKDDGTFAINMEGAGKNQTAEGTYKLDGKTLSMTTTKENGEVKAGKEEKVTLSDDMKSFDLPGAAAMGKMVKK